MMAAPLLNLLLADAQNIAAETKRKAPEVKAKADEAIQALKSLKESSNVAYETIRERVDILGMLWTALQSSQGSRLLPQLITTLHRLLCHGALPTSEKSLCTALIVLEAATVQGSEDVQLKALQCMIPLLTHYTCHGKVMVKVFEVGFRMVANRNVTVVNTAIAIVRQLLIWLFEMVQEEQKATSGKANTTNTPSNSFELPVLLPYASDAYIILQDIFFLANNEKALVLPMVALHKGFALELIESILTNNGKIFAELAAYTELMRTHLIPMLKQQLEERNNDFAFLCRLWRVVVILLREYAEAIPSEDEALLAITFCRLERADGAIWEKVLIMEATQELLMLGENGFDAFAGLQFSKGMVSQWTLIVEAVTSTAIAMIASLSSANNSTLHYNRALLKIPLLQLFEKQSPPTLTDAHLLHSSLMTLMHQIAAFDRLSTEEKLNRPMMLERVWALVQKPFLLALSSCSLDGGWRDFCLQGLHALLAILIKYEMVNAVDSTLMSMTEIALPQYQQASGKSPAPSMGSLIVNELNLSTSICILRFAQEYGEHLRASWSHVLHVIHGNDQFNIVKSRKPDLTIIADGSSSTSSLNTAGSGDTSMGISRKPSNPTFGAIHNSELIKIGEIAELEREIMENSSQLSGPSFKYFAKALSTLVTETMAMALMSPLTLVPSPTGKTTSLNSFKLTMVLFPVQRLKQILLLNIHRFKNTSEEDLNDAWNELMGRLVVILGMGDSAVRGIGCETINLALSQLTASIDPPLQLQHQPALQERIFGSLMKILDAGPWVDVHKTVLEVLKRLLTSLGPYLTDSWHTIFSILKESLRPVSNSVGEEQPTLPVLKAAFASTKMLAGEYLSNLDEKQGIMSLTELLFTFARIKTELNTSLTAIGLLWDLADFVRQRGGTNHSLFKQWIFIITELVKLAIDDRPDVRNSAVQTAIRSIDIIGSGMTADSRPSSLNGTNNLPLTATDASPSQSPSKWQIICLEILQPLMQNVLEASSNVRGGNRMETPHERSNNPNLGLAGSHYSRDSLAKQWDETVKYTIEGVVLLFSHFGTLLCTKVDGFRDREWRNLLNALCDQIRECQSHELINTAISCLAKLATSILEKEHIPDRDGYIEDICKAWKAMAKQLEYVKSDNEAFGQDSLIKLLRIFPTLMRMRGNNDKKWLADSLQCVNLVLCCYTPMDAHLRDTERTTELQQEALNIAESLENTDPDLYLKQLATWLNWVQELPVTLVSDLIASPFSRIRVSTSSTSTPINGPSASSANTQFTYIGLAAVSLESLHNRCSRPQGWAAFDRHCNLGDSWEDIIRALGRFATKKYRLPTGAGLLTLWKMATKCLNIILPAVIRLPGLTTLWHIIVRFLRKMLNNSSRLTNRDLTFDELEADEEFEASQVEFIRDFILPTMGDVSTDLIKQLLSALLINSKLYETKEESHDFSSDEEPPTTPSSTSLAVGNILHCRPVVKEKFAIACLHSLFTICADVGKEMPPKTKRNSISNIIIPQIEFPARVVEIALPMLLERCRSVMKKYIADRMILGRIPFPRIRQDEMLYVLKQLNDLTLCLTAQSLICPNAITSGGRRSHLLRLYQEYVQCISMDDRLILDSVQKAFELVGMEIGILDLSYIKSKSFL